MLAGTLASDPFNIGEILRRFREIADSVSIKLVHLSNISLVTELLNNKLDFIFYSSLSNHPGIESIYLSERTSYLYCHESHPFYHLDDHLISPEKVSNFETVRLLYGGNEDYKAVNAEVRWNFTASCNTLSGCLSLMKTGDYLGVMPESEMGQLAEKDKYRMVNPTLYKSAPIYNAFGFQKSTELSAVKEQFFQTVKSMVC